MKIAMFGAHRVAVMSESKHIKTFLKNHLYIFRINKLMGTASADQRHRSVFNFRAEA